MKRKIYPISWLFIVLILASCEWKNKPSLSVKDEKTISKKETYIREIKGKDDEVAQEIIEKGKVFISYSDCYTCHKEDKKLIGPSFQDINQRYPRNQVFIRILAQRIIHGGSGAWGRAVMSSHPKLRVEDAQAMVSYILSLDNE
ncbi:MAG: c-type cytochrome [Sphingobacterium sp.]